MGKHIYGIDFGTSNSVLAIVNKETREIVKVISEKSLIYFKDEANVIFGNAAIGGYIDNNMKGRLLKSVKTLLPQASFTFTYIYGKQYTAEDLVGLILRFLKEQADDFLGEDITEVVMGRPVVFSEDPKKDAMAEKRLRGAAQKAGFEDIWFQYEPIAAGFIYEQGIDKPETVLIGDFGGGTSDFTLMQLDKGKIHIKNRKDDILKTGGIYIGGDDFDAAIMWNKLVPFFGYGLQYDSYGKILDLPVHIFRSLCEWEQIAFLKEGKVRKSLDMYYQYTNKHPALLRLMKFIDNNWGYSLFLEIEQAKISVSTQKQTEIVFEKDDLHLNATISQKEFEDVIKIETEKIDAYLSQFLSSSGFPEIDNVFLTGGASGTIPVYELFTKRFSEEKIHRGDNFNSVAQGLALSYFYISGN